MVDRGYSKQATVTVALAAAALVIALGALMSPAGAQAGDRPELPSIPPTSAPPPPPVTTPPPAPTPDPTAPTPDAAVPSSVAAQPPAPGGGGGGGGRAPVTTVRPRVTTPPSAAPGTTTPAAEPPATTAGPSVTAGAPSPVAVVSAPTTSLLRRVSVAPAAVGTSATAFESVSSTNKVISLVLIGALAVMALLIAASSRRRNAPANPDQFEVTASEAAAAPVELARIGRRDVVVPPSIGAIAGSGSANGNGNGNGNASSHVLTPADPPLNGFEAPVAAAVPATVTPRAADGGSAIVPRTAAQLAALEGLAVESSVDSSDDATPDLASLVALARHSMRARS